MTSESFATYRERDDHPAFKEALIHLAACNARLKNTLYLLRIYVGQFRHAAEGVDRRLIRQYGIDWEKSIARVQVEQRRTAREQLHRLSSE